MMKYFKNALLLLCLFITTSSCKKADSGGGSNSSAPSNLVINANASTDGSGNVAFTASANNAATYDYELGDGTIKTNTNGSITYQYTLQGTNTFTVSVTAKSSSGLTLKKSIQVTVTVKPQTTGLIWSDEFDTDGAPDPTKWGYDIGAGGWGNNELEYYTNRSSNVIVQGGVLKITAKKEDYNGSTYTSARILSKNKFAFTYGRVEVRAKLPAGVGTWPAIWMLGSNIDTTPWPGCGEIDIMEHLGRDLNNIYSTLHYPGHSGANADGGTRMIANATTDFHVYSLDWSPTLIKISVDGQIVHSVTNTANIPFNHDFFFIMNLAMGGNFGGAVDPNFTSGTMEVDYIRVYK